ncbi:MAG: hypothetical protein LBN29_02015 [Mediterranea sp.]|jgi:hypothetical protein|nr:hypothetical protein [Mediterranea sp.]
MIIQLVENQRDLTKCDAIIESLKKGNHTALPQKVMLEICHAAKFLSLYPVDYDVLKSEAPDFILTNREGQRIGLELCRLVNDRQDTIGFYQGIFRNIEKELPNYNVPKSFIEITLNLKTLLGEVNKWEQRMHIKAVKPCLTQEDRKQLQSSFMNMILRKIEGNNSLEDEYISFLFNGRSVVEDIRVRIHSTMSLVTNFGAYPKLLTEEAIRNMIAKKNQKVISYKKSSCREIWLLIITGNVGSESYRLDDLGNISIDSAFDRMFILADFCSRIYEMR